MHLTIFPLFGQLIEWYIHIECNVGDVNQKECHLCIALIILHFSREYEQ